MNEMAPDKTKFRKWLFRTWLVATVLWFSYWVYLALIGSLDNVSSEPLYDGPINPVLAGLIIIPPVVICALGWFVLWAFEKD